jgi:hypothetical protein
MHIALKIHCKVKLPNQAWTTPWVQNTYCALLINKPERHEEAKNVCALAKNLIDKMTPEGWGRAYPGNDPNIYPEGLKAMQSSATENLNIINEH